MGLGFVLLFVTFAFSAQFDANTCKYTNDNGKVFDMSSLAQIELRSITDASYHLQICNPCKTCESLNKPGASVCQETVERHIFNLGLFTSQEVSALADNPDVGVLFVYSGGDQCNSGPERKTNVIVRCNSKATTPVIASVYEDHCEYFIYVDSTAGCPLGYVPPPDPDNNNSKKGLSAGSVLLIIFFVCVFVYLVGGCVYNYKFKGKSGVEMIPNFAFWSDLPYLCKDGFDFMINGFKKPQSYDSIE